MVKLDKVSILVQIDTSRRALIDLVSEDCQLELNQIVATPDYHQLFSEIAQELKRLYVVSKTKMK